MQRTAVGDYALGTLAIAMIAARALTLDLTGCIAKMVTHRDTEDVLKYRILQLLKMAFQLHWRDRAGAELIEQFLVQQRMSAGEFVCQLGRVAL